MAAWLKVLGAWLAGNNEAKAPVARSGERRWCVELHRLRRVFLAGMGAGETQIEVSFCNAIRIAKEQKSVSLEKRVEAPAQNIGGKKRAAQEDVDSDFLFDSFAGL